MTKHRTIPETMQAAAIDDFGGPEAISMHRLPVPKPAAREVLIAVGAVGVGVWDLKIRDGTWAEKSRFPMILGVDGAGVVVAVGSGVRRLKVGDRVYSYSFDNPKGGFYAQYVAVSAAKVARFPSALDMIHAGAVPATGLTALQGVDDVLKIKRGETLVVHGASGTVGSLAVQFARARGARVFATASGRRGVSFVRQLGAEQVIDGRRTDIVKAARKFAPDGVDAVLGFAGGKEFRLCLSVLRKGGRAAYPNGVEPEPAQRKGVTIQGYDARPGFRQLERLGAAIEEAELEIPIAEVFALEDAVKAHRRLARGHVLGKIVLKV